MISKIYPYNSTFIYNLNKLIGIYKNRIKDHSEKGWIPLKGVWTDSLKEYKNFVPPLDSNAVKGYKSIIGYCKKNNIQLYIVKSPYFGIYKTDANYTTAAKRIALAENIPFMDFSRDTVFLNHKNYFNDLVHVNVA